MTRSTRWSLPAPGLLAPLALALATPACAAGGALPDEAVVLTQGEDGATRTVPLGATFEVRLPAQLGTGYGWALVPVAGIEQLGEPVTRDGGTPGGTETQVFALRTTAKGRHAIAFSYGQPFAGGQKNAKMVRYTVVVP
ncbi:protease inhibitor I42 family protein [Sphingomonas sp.]|uniref:protease inhibitor I42 family protein n=1 Tax=Sphingomonas sp. TaxID=28214 RepID=UPI00179BE268|nr:protease inhibitor I42 family protein [Sphingomonas sp.]MBA4763328.1 protease inhibitor I42 family protein [Sphingomonas sp.]